ncbi:hypothetical protein [Methyloceanibacter marginalis]|uniref:hypothetical protein n=1 Tax=Methyloceanibacter marginalis TaxID=1774971 RepID=UPI00114CAADA|nr:hypothetical protein [Methyloceanibacter marginalis]
MRRVTAVLAASLSLTVCVWGSANAAPLNLNDVVEDESPEQLCERVAADPFEASGLRSGAIPSPGSISTGRSPPAPKP